MSRPGFRLVPVYVCPMHRPAHWLCVRVQPFVMIALHYIGFCSSARYPLAWDDPQITRFCIEFICLSSDVVDYACNSVRIPDRILGLICGTCECTCTIQQISQCVFIRSKHTACWTCFSASLPLHIGAVGHFIHCSVRRNAWLL